MEITAALIGRRGAAQLQDAQGYQAYLGVLAKPKRLWFPVVRRACVSRAGVKRPQFARSCTQAVKAALLRIKLATSLPSGALELCLWRWRHAGGWATPRTPPSFTFLRELPRG